MTFNLLRGKDLIWNPVVNHYLMGDKHPSFDLLHWNGDVTNLPAKWHKAYLTDLYRDNKLAQPGGVSALGEAIDLPRSRRRPTSRRGARTISRRPKACGRSRTISRGRSRSCSRDRDISPGWSNPPAAGKYQYWTGDSRADVARRFRRRRDRT